MRLIKSLVVVFVLVVNIVARSAQLRNDGTFIAHPEPSEELTKAQLLKELDVFDHDVKGDLPLAENVANLLYKTKAKKDTEVVEGVTVSELIAQNEFKSLEVGCTIEAFRERVKIYLKVLQTGRQPLDGVRTGINIYVVKLLRSATNHCLTNEYELLERDINTEDFIRSLKEAYYMDVDVHAGNVNEIAIAVSKGYMSKIARRIIDLDETEGEQDGEKKKGQGSATEEEAGAVQNKQKTGSRWWRKSCLSK